MGAESLKRRERETERGKQWGCSDAAVEDTTNIVDGSKVRQEGAQVGQLRVVRVVEPCRDGNSIVRVEDVGRGRVVDDDARRHFAAQLGEVLREGQPNGTLATSTAHSTLLTLT